MEAVADDLREGSSVVLRFGGDPPAGLVEHLEPRTGLLLEWTNLHAAEGAPPLSTVRRAIAPEARATDYARPRQIILDERFRGRLFWVDGLTPENWPRWRDFLDGFSHASRNAGATSRPPVLVLPLRGGGFETVEVSEPSIRIRDFRNVVDRDDLYVLVLQSRQVRGRRQVIRALLANAVAQIAQWDHVLAATLLRGGLEAALQPQAILRRYAEERGWTAETAESWEAGTLDGPRKRPIVHSALLLAQGREDELKRRLWAAQAAVLMPLLEERRLELVHRHRHRFELPSRPTTASSRRPRTWSSARWRSTSRAIKGTAGGCWVPCTA